MTWTLNLTVAGPQASGRGIAWPTSGHPGRVQDGTALISKCWVRYVSLCTFGLRIIFGVFCISQGALGCLWCPGQSLGDGPIALTLIGFAMKLSEIAVHCSFRLLLPVCYWSDGDKTSSSQHNKTWTYEPTCATEPFRTYQQCYKLSVWCHWTCDFSSGVRLGA